MSASGTPVSGHTVKQTRRSLLPPDLGSCTRSEIRDYFINSFDLYETLFTCIKDDASFYHQPDKLRLQLIFYLGHTAALYINKLQLCGFLKERCNVRFDSLFETGVDEMSWDEMEKCRLGGDRVWPSVADAWQYRQRVRQIVLEVIDQEPLELPLVHKDPWWAIILAIEHERIHLETSSVLLRQLPVDMLEAPEGWNYAPARTPGREQPVENEFVAVDANYAILGKPESFPSFGWDNEYGQATMSVPKFEATRYLITNREFLEFVEAGGYDKKTLWTTEGWIWRNMRQARHPTFWVCHRGCKSGCEGEIKTYSHCQVRAGAVEGRYRYRAMFDVLDMPWEWPAEVNYHEARAFCAWKGPDYRVPTEAEFYLMKGRQKPPIVGTECDIIYQKDVESRCNLNMAYCSSTPVDFYPPTDAGFFDIFGNVWEWMEDHFNGLPGAPIDYLYHDFSTPFYDGKHNLILSGSWISTGDSGSTFARFWFRRHFFQHMGFRMVRSTSPPPVRLIKTPVFQIGTGFEEVPVLVRNVAETSMVESTTTEFALDSDRNFALQLLAEYGSRKEIEFDSVFKLDPSMFRSQLASVCKATAFAKPTDSLLVVGSGTGQLAFELSKTFNRVIGTDYSARFVDASQRLRAGGKVAFPRVDGLPLPKREVSLPQDVDPSRVAFQQFWWMPMELSQFDMIVVNIMDRSSCPKYWLLRLRECLNDTGVLIISSVDWAASKLKPLLGKQGLQLADSRQFSQISLIGKESFCVSTVNITTWQASA